MALTKRKMAGSSQSSGAQSVAGRRRVDVDTSTYTGKLAARVRQLREDKGFSIEDLADRVGISAQTMYAYEANRRAIDPDLYPKLAKALGAKTLEDFFPPLK